MQQVLKQLGIKQKNIGTSTGKEWIDTKGKEIISYSPVDGKPIASVTICDDKAYEQVVQKAGEAFLKWRMYPAPKRGEIVRQVGVYLVRLVQRASDAPLHAG